MRIVLNGDSREVQSGMTVTGLLESLAIKDARVAIEVNLDVIRREDRATRVLKEGDRVEIVSFVGGGR